MAGVARGKGPSIGTSARRPSLALPGIRTARGYRRAWLLPDITAGLALTGILVPAGMAYAEASGLPAVTGLYATIVPLLVYALVGPSRLLMLGPDSSLVPLVLAAIAPFAALDASAAVPAAAALAIVTGALIAGAGLARLGFLADLLSRPARVGFLSGIALVIVVSQLPRLLGFPVEASAPVQRLQGVLEGIAAGLTNPTALTIGLGCLVAILGLRAWRPRWPAVLVAMVGALLVSAVLDLAARTGIAVVGPLPQGLPTLSIPDVDLGDLVALLPAAAGIALVTAADTIVLSRTFAVRNGYEADPNHELAAVGTANIAAGFFAGYPVSSSASRTAVAEAAGTRTQLTGVVGALAIAALVVLAPGLVADLPASALAAVVIAAAMSLADPGAFVRLWRQRPGELALALVTFLGVVVLGVIEGIFLAVLLSVLAFLRRAWWPHDAVLGRATGVKGYHDLRYYPEARQVPGLVLYRFDAPLLFFNGEAFRQRVLDQVVRAEPPARWVVVAAEPITDVDTTAAAALELLLEELATAGVTLAFAELKDPVKARLRRYGTMAMIGEDRCFPTVGTAVDAYVEATGETWVDWEEAGPEPAIPALPARPAPDARSGEAPGPNG